jgi:class 3 adenylate cyclase
MESEDLTHLLNSYLREMTDIALRYGATVDKYIGDAIMIFFGDPESQGVSQDARLCVEMALEMQMRARDLQKQWRTDGYGRPFSIRVGIHTGYCTVGNFGTESRMDYTIIGSPVNQASRIESSAEPGTIYISEDTYLLVKNQFDCIPVAKVKLKGLSNPVELFRVRMNAEQDGVISMHDTGFQLNVELDKLTETSKERLRQALDKALRKEES